MHRNHAVKRIANPMHEHVVTVKLSQDLCNDLAAMLAGAEPSQSVRDLIADLPTTFRAR